VTADPPLPATFARTVTGDKGVVRRRAGAPVRPRVTPERTMTTLDDEALAVRWPDLPSCCRAPTACARAAQP
jgi:hypothetical protein